MDHSATETFLTFPQGVLHLMAFRHILKRTLHLDDLTRLIPDGFPGGAYPYSPTLGIDDLHLLVVRRALPDAGVEHLLYFGPPFRGVESDPLFQGDI